MPALRKWVIWRVTVSMAGPRKPAIPPQLPGNSIRGAAAPVLPSGSASSTESGTNSVRMAMSTPRAKHSEHRLCGSRKNPQPEGLNARKIEAPCPHAPASLQGVGQCGVLAQPMHSAAAGSAFSRSAAITSPQLTQSP